MMYIGYIAKLKKCKCIMSGTMAYDEYRPTWDIWNKNDESCDCDICFENPLPHPEKLGDYPLVEICKCKDCECI